MMTDENLAGCHIVRENTEDKKWEKVSKFDSNDIALITKTNELIETYGLNPMDFKVVLERPLPWVSLKDTDNFTDRLRFESIPSFDNKEKREKAEEMFADLGVKLGDLTTNMGYSQYQCPVIVGTSPEPIYNFLNNAIRDKKASMGQSEVEAQLPNFAGRFR